jgi:hypothetical protein
MMPSDFEMLFRRDDTAARLKAIGFPVEATTLATMASRGGGPPFRLFGRVPLYRWGDVLSWAQGRLGLPCRSSAERDKPQQPTEHGSISQHETAPADSGKTGD